MDPIDDLTYPVAGHISTSSEF